MSTTTVAYDAGEVCEFKGIFTEFETLDLKDIYYILRGFNLLQKEMHSSKLHKEFSTDIRKYTKVCSTYGFKQLISCPIRTTRSNCTLNDHILTNTQ